MDSVELVDPPKSSGSIELESSSSNLPSQLSKKAQKKAAKAARYAAQKLERRAKEKEAKKEKKRIRAEKRAAGQLEEDEAQAEEEKRRAMKRAKTGAGQKPFGAKVCIDLGFDEMMTDKVDCVWSPNHRAHMFEQEIISLCSQLAYTYSANRRSTRPFSSILFTSVNGRTLKRLEGMNNAGYKRWTNTEWWQEGYKRLWSGGREESLDGGEMGNDECLKVAQENVIYLTADSEEELLELKEGEVYIIGGICDHNRYKVSHFSTYIASRVKTTARIPHRTSA